MQPAELLIELERLFRDEAAEASTTPGVSPREHALQTARHALDASAPEELILAAWLHDIGHLIEAAAPDHDAVGARWLAGAGFAPDVTQVIAGHVAAKRYLAAVSPRYAERLELRARASLVGQGGPMNAHERHVFERQPWHGAALWLRSWDDRARCPGRHTSHLDDLLNLAEQHVLRRPTTRRSRG